MEGLLAPLCDAVYEAGMNPSQKRLKCYLPVTYPSAFGPGIYAWRKEKGFGLNKGVLSRKPTTTPAHLAKVIAEPIATAPQTCLDPHNDGRWTAPSSKVLSYIVDIKNESLRNTIALFALIQAAHHTKSQHDLYYVLSDLTRKITLLMEEQSIEDVRLAPRVWYTGSLSRCDYSEMEDKGYHLVTLLEPDIRPDLSDLQIEFRLSPTRRMVEIHAVYENGDFLFSEPIDPSKLEDSRVKVIVTVGNGIREALGREQQEDLRERLLAANPAELKVKIEHEAETAPDTTPLSVANSAEEKLRVYWELKGSPPADQQGRLLARLGQIETAIAQDGNG